MINGYAEFKVMLPTGGRFYAAWPQTVSDMDLRMVKAMLDANLEMWIDHLKAVAAGEAEYASWSTLSPPIGEHSGKTVGGEGSE